MKGSVHMSAPVYRWIVVYEDGHSEEKYGEDPSEFTAELTETPIAIIRHGYQCF